MGYKVLADKFEMDEMRVKYGPRKGLEGPFNSSPAECCIMTTRKVSTGIPRQTSMLSSPRWT